MDPESFTDIMRHHASTVVVLTVGEAGNQAGMTATSFTSVSLDPPLVLVCVARTASTWSVLSATDRMRIHVLGDGAQDLARRFAAPGGDRFTHPAMRLDDGQVTIAGALAWLECAVVDRIPAGDHHIVLAAPTKGELLGNEHGPLVYHDRRYASVRSPGS